MRAAGQVFPTISDTNENERVGARDTNPRAGAIEACGIRTPRTASPRGSLERSSNLRHGSEQHEGIVLGRQEPALAPESGSLRIDSVHDERATADEARDCHGTLEGVLQ